MKGAAEHGEGKEGEKQKISSCVGPGLWRTNFREETRQLLNDIEQDESTCVPDSFFSGPVLSTVTGELHSMETGVMRDRKQHEHEHQHQ